MAQTHQVQTLTIKHLAKNYSKRWWSRTFPSVWKADRLLGF